MAKTLLIAAVVVSFITAGLGFYNHGVLSQTKQDLSDTQTTLATTKKTLDTTKSELATTKTTLDSTTLEKDKVSAELSSTKSELDTAKSQLTAANTSLTEKETQIQTLTTDLETTKKALADATSGTAAIASTPTEDPRVKELEALVASQNDKIKASESQLAELRKREEARRTKQMQQGLEGRVLAVNPAWNFVVLSIGDKQGVVNNAELLLKRGGQYLGKVRVTSVEPSTSIADIVANSLPSGVAVQPGDSVIFQASEN